MKKYFLLTVLFLKLFSANSQNVGIGISNPTRAKLEVNGGSTPTKAIFGGETTGISLQANWPTIGFNQYYNNGHRYIANGYAAQQFLDPVSGHLVIDLFSTGTANSLVSGTKRVFAILQSGNVVLGPVYANSSFVVSKNAGSDATAYLIGTKHSSAINYGATEDTYIRAGKDNGRVIINDIAGGEIAMFGNVGINSGDPTTTLEVRQHNGTGFILIEPSHFNNWETRVEYWNPARLFFIYNGTFKSYLEPGDGSFHHYSDLRLKKNIAPLSTLLSKVMQLNPVTYEMKDNNPSQIKSIGFIAQEVKEIFPELVSETRDTAARINELSGLMALNYSDFGVLAVKAIQEQQQIIQSQQTQIDELRKMINGLTKAVPVEKTIQPEKIKRDSRPDLSLFFNKLERLKY